MIKIFFSHGTTDSNKIDGAEKFFMLGGQIKVWNFRKHSNYLSEIPQNVADSINNSDYFFLFWSSSVANKIAWIEHEFLLADEIEKELRNHGDKNAFIRIILLDDTPLPDEMRGKRYIKFTQDQFEQLKEAVLQNGPRKQVELENNQLTKSVSEIMTPKDKLLTVTLESRLMDAFILMATADVRHLIVLDSKGDIAGFVSQRDVRKRIPPKLSQIKKVGEAVDVNLYQKAIATAGSIPISSVMTPFSRLISLNEGANIQDALDSLLKEYDFGRISALPVITGKQAIGLVSYMDLLCKLDIPNLLVENSMKTDNLFHVLNSQEVGQVDLLMKQAGIRHIAVFDMDNSLVGMIDDITIFWLIHETFRLHHYPVEKFMQPIESSVYLYGNSNLVEVVDKLFCIDKHITALPVVDDSNGFKKLVGILSYVDILKAVRNFQA